MGKLDKKLTGRKEAGNTPILPVRVPRQLKARIVAAAKAEGLSISEWIRAQCERGCRVSERKLG